MKEMYVINSHIAWIFGAHVNKRANVLSGGGGGGVWWWWFSCLQ